MSDQINNFEQAMRRESVLAALSKTTIDTPRFINDAVQLIENKPNLLSVDDPESLIAAFIECAQYGFYPNGDEGYFEVNNNKISQSQSRRIARYELTTSGIRSIAKRHDILINANIVHKNDQFRHEEGDNPLLDHVIQWDHPDGRGEAYLVYAIFKHKDGTILHREVMDKEMLDAVKKQSKVKNGGMLWNEFWTEGWKKAVIRRGSKTVKLSHEVESAARQIDRDYSFGGEQQQPAPEKDEAPKEAKPKEKSETKPATNKKAAEKSPARRPRRRAEDKKEEEPPQKPEQQTEPETDPEPDWDSMSEDDLDSVWNDIEGEILQSTSVEELELVYKRREAFISKFDTDGHLVSMFKAQKSTLA